MYQVYIIRKEEDGTLSNGAAVDNAQTHEEAVKLSLAWRKALGLLTGVRFVRRYYV